VTRALAAACLLFALPAAADPPRLAVVVVAPGMDTDAAFALETRVFDVAEGLAEGRVLDRETTRLHLAAARQMGAECPPDDLPCLSDLAARMIVTRLLVVSVRDDAVAASLIDAGGPSVRRSVELEAAAPASAAPRAVRAVLAPQHAGALVLQLDPSDAVVTVAGERVRGLRVEGLEPGVHEVVATMPGYEDLRANVTIVAGHDAVLGVELVPAASAGLSPLVFGGGGAIAGGVAVALVGGGLGYAGALMSLRLPPGSTFGDVAAAKETARAFGGLTVASLAVGAVLVAAGCAALVIGLLEGGE
jgi:hypothetical protein